MTEEIYNNIIVGIVSSLFVALLFWIIKKINVFIRTQKIVDFLEKSIVQGQYKFRSTHAISSSINLPEEIVVNLCSKSSKIKRNGKEKESWRIA